MLIMCIHACKTWLLLFHFQFKNLILMHDSLITEVSTMLRNQGSNSDLGLTRLVQMDLNSRVTGADTPSPVRAHASPCQQHGASGLILLMIPTFDKTFVLHCANISVLGGETGEQSLLYKRNHTRCIFTLLLVDERRDALPARARREGDLVLSAHVRLQNLQPCSASLESF